MKKVREVMSQVYSIGGDIPYERSNDPADWLIVQNQKFVRFQGAMLCASDVAYLIRGAPDLETYAESVRWGSLQRDKVLGPAGYEIIRDYPIRGYEINSVQSATLASLFMWRVLSTDRGRGWMRDLLAFETPSWLLMPKGRAQNYYSYYVDIEGRYYRWWNQTERVYNDGRRGFSQCHIEPAPREISPPS